MTVDRFLLLFSKCITLWGSLELNFLIHGPKWWEVEEKLHELGCSPLPPVLLLARSFPSLCSKSSCILTAGLPHSEEQVSLLPQLHPPRTLLTLRQLSPSFSLFAFVSTVDLSACKSSQACQSPSSRGVQLVHPFVCFQGLLGGGGGLNWLILFPPEPCTAQS